MGARIRTVREGKLPRKMSQEELATLVGVKKGMISAIERGTDMPSAPVLIKIGRELGTGVDELVYGSQHPYQQQTLPGMGLDERINGLPPALREFMVLTLKRVELIAKVIPQQFTTAPTNESYQQFNAYLDALSKTLPPPEEGEAA